MADITRFLFLRHLRANPTAHVRHLRRGLLAHEGSGQAFRFRPLNAALSEIPVDDREQSLLFHGKTADFQDPPSRHHRSLTWSPALHSATWPVQSPG